MDQTDQSNWNLKHQTARCLILFVSGIASTVFALRVVGQVDHFVPIWPASGVAIALILPFWQQSIRRRFTLLAAAAGVFAGCLAVHMPFWLAVLLPLLTCVDIIVASSLMGTKVQRFDDLKLTANLVRFASTTLCAPLVTGLLGTFPVARFLHEPVVLTAVMNVLANALGIALLVPIVLFISDRKEKQLAQHLLQNKNGVFALTFFVMAAVFTFYQNFGPFLFIVFPPMLLVVLTLGLEGAVVASAALTGIGWIATYSGHGPIWLAHGISMEQRLMILQIFIWVALAKALPIGAILDERRRAERKAEEATSIYQTLLEHAEDMIVLSSLSGTERYVSPGVEKLTGWTPDEYLALDRLNTFHPDDLEIAQTTLASMKDGQTERTIRYRMMQKDGGFRWVEALVRPYGGAHGSKTAGYVGTIRDISELKKMEQIWEEERANLTGEHQRMSELASTDALTGLLNRRGLEAARRHSERRKAAEAIAVLMIDVDFFKLYNDTLGHSAGDVCLATLARVFAAQITRRDDYIARLGGEEFGIVLHSTDSEGGRRVAERILVAVRNLRLEHPASPVGIVTVSIGVTASVPGEPTVLASLLCDADGALYTSKKNGRNQSSVTQPAVDLIVA